MYRETIRLTDRSDADDVLARFAASVGRADLSTPAKELLNADVRRTVLDLIEHGRQVAAVGSKMSASRRIEGDGYQVSIAINADGRQSILSRLLALFGGGNGRP